MGAAILLKLAPIGAWLLKAAKGALNWAIAHPWQIACVVFLALWLITRGDLHDEQATSAKLRGEVTAEKAAHQKTKHDYRAAQAQAAKLEQQRLVRVKADQQEITDEVTQDYRRRLADARATAERLRRERREAGAEPAGAGATVGLPGVSAGPGGADAPAGGDRLPQPARTDLDWRLIATEQAIQLDELITWVERQGKVRVNEPAGEP